MSRYAPNLDRTGIPWAEPGIWKQGQDIVHLQTFAEKMIIPAETGDADSLNSIPTPWSRLLLFESALFNPEHPSHREILDQWRGLLGVLALANPLGIEVLPGSQEMTIDLNNFAAQSLIAKTFLDLRPSYSTEGVDSEAKKWRSFHLISVDGQILGSTSPRTLVFTSISQSLSSTVPFSEDGHLYDPLKYYRKFNDQKYLALLRSWLTTFINDFKNNQTLIDWLGTFPAPIGTVPQRRHDKLLNLIRTWLNEVYQALPGDVQLPPINKLQAHFTLPYYKDLLFLPEIPYDPKSDLLLNTKKTRDKNVIVCYRPDNNPNPKKNSMLYNERNLRIQSDNLKISDGRWVKADETLPERMRFLPRDWEVISNPVEELFEDKLIEINLPMANDHALYSLSINAKSFLFPFRKRILDYFEPEEIHRYTKIAIEPNIGYYITLELPLRGTDKRKIVASRFYEESQDETLINIQSVDDHKTAELAMWPKFKSPNWSYHYYFKRSIAENEVDFDPVSDNMPRSNADNSSYWYFTNSPVLAFTGHLQGNEGLLLPKYEELAAQGREDLWNVAVDFGSTHTRAFYLRMQNDGGENYTRTDDARVESLEFNTYAKQLTVCDPEILKNDFFALEGKITPSSRAELKTLLMRPVDQKSDGGEWYPREGFGYLHWIHGGFDSRKIKSNIKWEGTGNKDDLRSYLRWLMVQILAEAIQQNARVVKVLRSYPTSFNPTLKAHHNDEWVGLGNFIGIPMILREEEEVSEAIATARYLNDREGAKPVLNTISFDIGGSTTDIAIWFGKLNEIGIPQPTLAVNESVKMAAGIVGKYLQTDPEAMEFLNWFLGAVNAHNYLGNISLSAFGTQRNGYALMFYNILSYYEQGNAEVKERLSTLLGKLKSEPTAVGLLAHINYLFGSLIYYSGQLSRKAGLHESEDPTYHLYFCGKGGMLIKWINNYEGFVKNLFLAGLYGADSQVSLEKRNKANVEVRVSQRPKEEVGRGLLVQFMYKQEEDDEAFGLFDLRAPSVTVGETGFSVRTGETGQSSETKEKQTERVLDWDAKLDENVMLSLSSKIPAFDEMKELNHFVTAISEAFGVQDERAPIFDFKEILKSDDVKRNYVNTVKASLFNTDETGILFKLQQKGNTSALIEPLIITEMKVLLEFLSKNTLLFR